MDSRIWKLPGVRLGRFGKGPSQTGRARPCEVRHIAYYDELGVHIALARTHATLKAANKA